MTSRDTKGRTFYFALAILAVAALLRFGLAWVNRESNDDHYNGIILPLVQGRTFRSLLSVYHPRLYHNSMVFLIQTLHLTTTTQHLRCLNLFNALVGWLTVLLVYAYLRKEKMAPLTLLCCLSFVAFNPAFIAINAQGTNDTLLIFFAVAATYFSLRLLREESWLSPRALGLLSLLLLQVAGAIATKGNGLILALCLVGCFGAQVYFRSNRAKDFLLSVHVPLLLAMTSLSVGFANPVYMDHPAYARFVASKDLVVGKFVGTVRHVLPSSPEGKKVLTVGFLNFPIHSLIELPANKVTTKAHYLMAKYPVPHMHSYWGQLYGNFSFSRFHYWPPTWRKAKVTILYLARALVVSNLVTLTLILTGIGMMGHAIVKRGPSPYRRQEALLFTVFVAFLFAGMRYYMMYPSPPFAKFIYVAPFLLSITYALARAQESLRQRWPVYAPPFFASFFLLLALMNISDVIWLTRDLRW